MTSDYHKFLEEINEIAYRKVYAEGHKNGFEQGFDDGIRAVLHQLDGLIDQGYDRDDIVGWVEMQLEEM